MFSAIWAILAVISYKLFSNIGFKTFQAYDEKKKYEFICYWLAMVHAFLTTVTVTYAFFFTW